MYVSGNLIHERERLAALRDLDIIGKASEPAMDAVTRLLSGALKVPMAAVSLVDEAQVWFWSRHGFDVATIPRAQSFCAYTIQMSDVVVVEDANTDPRFGGGSTWHSASGWRFYAGIPIRLPSGQVIGTLAVMDTEPRKLTEPEQSMLRDARQLVESHLAVLEGSMARLTHQFEVDAKLAAILGSMSEAVLFLDADERIVSSNPVADGLPEFVLELLQAEPRAASGRIVDENGDRVDALKLPHRQVLATGVTQRHRVLGMRREPQGATLWYEMNSEPILSRGKVVGAVCSLLDVSRHQLVLQALQSSEHKLQAMAANVPGVLYQFCTYPDGRVEFPYISNGIERLYGITADRWREKPDWALESILDEDKESYAAAFVAAQATLSRFDWEGRTRTARMGEVIWIHCQSLPTVSNDGSILWNGVTSDITGSKGQEDALRASEERFRLVVEQTQQMVYDVDTVAGTVVWVGATWSLLGRTTDELQSLALNGWMDLIHPDDRTNTVACVEHSRFIDEPFGVRYRMRRRDGAYVWVHDRGIFVRGARGRPVRMLGTISDVTLEMSALAASEDSQRRAEALIAAIPDTVIRLSSSGVILDVRHSPAWFGEKDQTLQRIVEIKDLLPPEVESTCLKQVRAVVDQRMPALFDLRVAQDNKQIDLEVRVSPSGEDEAVMVLRDVTDQRAVERLKGQFVSTVSHELRTPLASIRGALGLMTAGIAGDLPPMTQELSELALENTKRLERLINDLLDLESSDSGQLRLTLGRFDLRQLLERNIHAVMPFAASLGVGLRFETEMAEAEALVDADRFGQIISNLLSNAMKHSRPDCDVVLSLYEQANNFLVEVHNQGNPIPERFRSQMFQRFAMADASDARKRGGTGLGLAIARALVERMDGKIDYLSDEQGTRFFVELPRPKPQGSRAPRGGASVPCVSEPSRPWGCVPSAPKQ